MSKKVSGNANSFQRDYLKAKQIVQEYEKQLNISVTSSSIPNPPEPPLSRVLREGVGHFCTNCGSTMPKSGFLMLFGKRYCDNDKCPNSKPLTLAL